MATKTTLADIRNLTRRDLTDRLTSMGEYTADWREAKMAVLQRRLGIATGAIILAD